MSDSRRRSRRRDGEGQQGGNGEQEQATPMPGTTGRYLVLMRQEAMQAGIQTLSDAGLRVANTAETENGAIDSETLTHGEAIVFDRLAVAVVDTPPAQLQVLSAAAAEEGGILAVEPERVVYALDEEQLETTDFLLETPPVPLASARSRAAMPLDYLMGYRDAVNHLVDSLLVAGGVPAAAREGADGMEWDETNLTWGLQATRVAESRFSGRGVRVAILDTGFDLEHPDFIGRRVVAKSFVLGESAQDGHGHGTHCIGTACGPRQPIQLPRYGIAYESEIYAGKVLSNRGSGTDSSILAGINWAITNGCRVISMSLGASVEPGQGFSRIFEFVARRALAAGTLIIAAAGNESQRPGFIAPVGHPANCPSIMAVAALDQAIQTAAFSCGGLNPQGGQVDIAGPGVNVRSSWPRPLIHRTISGTSMATPHVAGIAALHAEANPDVVGGALGWLLLQSARRLEVSARDAGAGLVQAP